MRELIQEIYKFLIIVCETWRFGSYSVNNIAADVGVAGVGCYGSECIG